MHELTRSKIILTFVNAYRNRHRVLFKRPKYTLTKEKIGAAKRNYSEKPRNQFSAHDPASAWKGQKDITKYITYSHILT